MKPGQPKWERQYITISRTLWAITVNALDGRDPAAQRSALHQLLATVPASWDTSLHNAQPRQERSDPAPTTSRSRHRE